MVELGTNGSWFVEFFGFSLGRCARLVLCWSGEVKFVLFEYKFKSKIVPLNTVNFVKY